MKKRGFLYGLIAVVIMTAVMVPVTGKAAGSAVLTVNNNVLSGNAPPAEYGGNLLAPAKELAQALGGTFTYDNAGQTGTLRRGETELVFRLDNPLAKVNGKYVQTPSPMKILGNRFMIPVRFTAEQLGAQVFFRSDKNTTIVLQPVNDKLVYRVVSGDTLWLLSQAFNTSISELKAANGLTGDNIYIGQSLIIKKAMPGTVRYTAQTSKSATLFKGPDFSQAAVDYLTPWTNITVTGKLGEWFKVETPKGNGYIYSTVISIPQNQKDTAANSGYFAANLPVDTSANRIVYNNYTVQKGDNLWALSEKFNITDYDLAAANGLSRTAMLYIGQILKIPVHAVAVKSTPGPQYGEVLDWFQEAQYVFPVGKTGKLVDLQTGKSFMIQRTMGANHSDTETLTAQDTAKMKEIFGGAWSWTRRPFLLEVEGRKFAVSVAGMPHAGVDGVPYLQEVSNRSDAWGYGPTVYGIKTDLWMKITNTMFWWREVFSNRTGAPTAKD